MKKDNILITGVIGGLSTLAGEAVTKALMLCGVGQYAVFELNSLIVTSETPSFWMGFICNFVVGSYVGVAAYLLFKRLGTSHLVLKCMMGSLMIWFLFELAFTFFIEGIFIDIRPVSDHFVHIIGTAAYGLTLGVFLKLFVFKVKAKERDDSKPEAVLQKPVG